MGSNGDHQSGRTVKRIGMVIKLRPEHLDRYLELHADTHPGVRDLLIRYHLENFSIFLHRIGDEYFEFGYYEYAGTDFASDMAALAAEERNIEWLRICDPMQMPLEGENGWATMQQIYYNGV